MSSVTRIDFTRRTQMLTQDLDSTASYRTLARGFGCGFARAYAASQRDRAASCAPARGDLGAARLLGAANGVPTAQAEQRRFRA
jgi:hypothetical protein